MLIPGACDELDATHLEIAGLHAEIATYNIEIGTLTSNIAAKSASAVTKANVSNSAYKLAAAGCCKADEAKAMLVSMPLQCDTSFPGDLPLPVLAPGKCYNMVCVNLHRSIYWAAWSADVKPYSDVLCDLFAEQQAYIDEADVLEGLIALDTPLCYSGDAAACARMRMNEDLLDIALANAAGYDSEIAIWTGEVARRMAIINVQFHTSILGCIINCF